MNKKVVIPIVVIVVLFFAYAFYLHITSVEGKPDAWKKVYIEDIFIRPKLIHEGMDFNVLFSVVNKYPVTGYVKYEFYYPYGCLELNGSDEGQLNLWSYRDDNYQTFYTPFHVKENLSKDCYKDESSIWLVIKNSKETLDIKKVYFDFAIPMDRIEELRDI